MSLIRKQHNKHCWFQTAAIFHLILTVFMSSSAPCSDHAITILGSLIKKIDYSSLFLRTFIHREFSTRILKTALAKCFSALHLCACCSAYQTDKLSRPPRYLAQTAHASISSCASISLSVTACLFIQLELFESLKLPWCVSVPAGRDLCVQCLPFSKFSLILCPSMVPKCRANEFKEEHPVCGNTDCCDSSIFFLLFRYIAFVRFFYSMQILCFLCVSVLLQWLIVCLCMAPVTFHAT